MEGSSVRERLRLASKMRIRQARNQSHSPKRIPRCTVISFINMLQKADQYFELKNHVAVMSEILTGWCVPEETREDLVGKLSDDERFNKLDKQEIRHALNALNDEFQVERFRQNAHAYITNEGNWDWDREEVIDLEPEVVYNAKILQKFPFLSPEYNVMEMDGYVSSDPIYALAFQTRIKGRVLHRDPEVELKKLKKTCPFYYYDFFIAEEQNYKAQGKLEIGGRPVGVIPTTCNRLPSGVPACKSGLAMSAFEKVEDGLLTVALQNYSKLVEMSKRRKRTTTSQGNSTKHKTNSDQPDNELSG